MSDSNFKNALQGMLNKKETPNSILNKSIRFSITLTNLQNKRLEILTSKLSTSKQDFIQTIIEAALRDIESELGLIDAKDYTQLGDLNLHYRTKYIREIVASLGISEDEWENLVESARD
ncbi:hypothetical protein MKX42_30295 [Paenibacillus sp. FSL R7-0204]|uniref:hypothetical protein n=1 Tax=Paenibacillus sp. FSL R7-0204 TaxID=2921675 RepID=UPI0030FBC3CB